MSEETKVGRKRVRVNHTYPESVETKVANHFVIQHDEESFTLSFFEIRQPIILGDTTTEIAAQVDDLDNSEDARENLVIVRSGILPKLIERALQESPSDDWRRELDEL